MGQLQIGRQIKCLVHGQIVQQRNFLCDKCRVFTKLAPVNRLTVDCDVARHAIDSEIQRSDIVNEVGEMIEVVDLLKPA